MVRHPLPPVSRSAAQASLKQSESKAVASFRGLPPTSSRPCSLRFLGFLVSSVVALVYKSCREVSHRHVASAHTPKPLLITQPLISPSTPSLHLHVGLTSSIPRRHRHPADQPTSLQLLPVSRVGLHPDRRTTLDRRRGFGNPARGSSGLLLHPDRQRCRGGNVRLSQCSRCRLPARKLIAPLQHPDHPRERHHRGSGVPKRKSHKYLWLGSQRQARLVSVSPGSSLHRP